MSVITLDTTAGPLSFRHVPLHVTSGVHRDVFARKNNKTLRQTLTHPRYSTLSGAVTPDHAPFLDWGLGTFLLDRKQQGDPIYRRFLNPYGDLTYSTFVIQEPDILGQRGLYLFTVRQEVRYVGRCRDAFKKRLNQGYGRIHPKNCYRDGQSTNCHLNALITEHLPQGVGLFVHPLTDPVKITALERTLIGILQPIWNTALKDRTFPA